MSRTRFSTLGLAAYRGAPLRGQRRVVVRGGIEPPTSPFRGALYRLWIVGAHSPERSELPDRVSTSAEGASPGHGGSRVDRWRARVRWPSTPRGRAGRARGRLGGGPPRLAAAARRSATRARPELAGRRRAFRQGVDPGLIHRRHGQPALFARRAANRRAGQRSGAGSRCYRAAGVMLRILVRAPAGVKRRALLQAQPLHPSSFR